LNRPRVGPADLFALIQTNVLGGIEAHGLTGAVGRKLLGIETARFSCLGENRDLALIGVDDDGHLRAGGGSLAREAREYYEQAERFEESQRLYSRGGAEVSTNISQALLEFAIAERERTPKLYENFDPRSGANWNIQGGLVAAERALMIEKFMQSFEERIEAEAGLRDMLPRWGLRGRASAHRRGCARTLSSPP